MFFFRFLGTFKTASKRIPDAIYGLELQPTTDVENSGRGKRLKRKIKQFNNKEEPEIPEDVSDDEEDEYIGLDNGMGEDIYDMETQPITYVAAATSKGKGKALLPAVPAGLLNKNRAIMPPPSSAPSKTQYVPVGTAASEVPAGVLRRTPIEYMYYFFLLCWSGSAHPRPMGEFCFFHSLL